MSVAALEAAVRQRDGQAARRAVPSPADDAAAQEAGLELLARLAAEGSTLAVELLVELVDELGLARKAVRSFLLDEAAVDDVTQDTLVAVAQSVASFRGDAKFTSWLYQLARYRSVDFIRRQRATVPLDEREPGPALRISSMVASGNAVQQLLARLPEPYRQAVRQRDVDRLSYAELAQESGRNLNTVKSHVARGRAMLAAIIEAEGWA